MGGGIYHLISIPRLLNSKSIMYPVNENFKKDTSIYTENKATLKNQGYLPQLFNLWVYD